MSGLTVITFFVVVSGVIGPGGYGHALALGGATAAGAAVFVAGTAVPTFYAVALGTAVALFLRALGNGRSPALDRVPLPPAAPLLILFLVWSASVTLVAPLIFDGAAIVTPEATSLRAGVLTTSNLAQMVYLFLGVCVVIYLARSPVATPELIGLSVGTAILLSSWRYVAQTAGLPFPEDLFDNSPSFAYIETAAGGAERFRGIFSEPAALAGTSVVTIAYMLSRARQVHGLRRLGALTVAAIACYLGVISTSTTFVVAGLALVLVATLVGLVAFLSGRARPSRVVGIAGCALVVVGLWVLPVIASFVSLSVNDKLLSSSFDERSGSNADSYGVFLDTFGVGVGLGSARASSFLPTLLSATGLIGALLFAAAVLALIVQGWAVSAYRPVVWALTALLLVKVAAGPDLSDTSGILWMSLGLLSRAALERQRAPMACRAASRAPSLRPVE